MVEPLSVYMAEYMQRRTLLALHQTIIARFIEERDAGRVTVETIASRIGKRPYMVRRWLGWPTRRTLTIDQAALLMIGIAGEELTFGTRPVSPPTASATP